MLALAEEFRGTGEMSKSNQLLFEVLEIYPGHPEAFFWLSNQFNLNQNTLLANKLEESYKNPQRYSINQFSYLCYAMARLRENQERYSESFSLYQQANKLRKSSLNILRTDSNIYIGQSKLHKSLFRGLKKMPTYVLGSDIGNDLVFIIGLPRCGSTLVEAILSMSNKTKCLGESGYLQKAVSQSEILKSLETGDISLIELKEKLYKIDSFYRSLIKPTSHIKVEKTLTNFFLAGLISRVWPAAKIVHMQRNPLDQIVSIWRSRFLKGNSYSLVLDNLVDVFISYVDLMSLWKAELGSRMYTCNYEELVTEPFESTKRLANFCEIEWTEEMLTPKNSKLIIKTASYKQVRDPINKKSIGFWRNYSTQLEEYIKKLNDAGITF